MDSNPKLSFQVIADEIASKADTDVLFLNGPIEERSDGEVLELCGKRRRRTNVLLVLVTNGGEANEAYRIARFLQLKYKRFTILVSGYCKSAGTLVAVGAHELVMSDEGQLGPLDVQLLRKDELFEVQSGLTATSALQTLNEQAYLAFERYLLEVKIRGRPTITARMATDIAVRLTIGFFSPIYQQIDPIHIGEAGRANDVAVKYGEILARESANLKPNALENLTSEYPSHDFVIDRKEAQLIFKTVREPNELEGKLIAALKLPALLPVDTLGGKPIRAYLSSEVPVAKKGEGNGSSRGGGVARGRVQEPSVQKDKTRGSRASGILPGRSPADASLIDGAKREKIKSIREP